MITDIEDQFEYNRLRIQMYDSVGALDFLIRDEDMKKRFRAAKPKEWDDITLKGEIRLYSNSFDIFMYVEDFEY